MILCVYVVVKKNATPVIRRSSNRLASVIASKKKVSNTPMKASEKGILCFCIIGDFVDCAFVSSVLVLNDFVIVFTVILSDSESEDDGESEIRERRSKNKQDGGL